MVASETHGTHPGGDCDCAHELIAPQARGLYHRGMARSSDSELLAPPSVTAAASAGDGARANPYVGPRSLRYGEHIYGRDREARQLLELLIAERIVLLYSPSGAGKTSLIQAALIPELEAEEFHVLPVIRVGRGTAEEVSPGNPYVMSVLLSLEQGVGAEDAIPVAELAAMQLSEYLQRREAREDSGDGTFLIFDQFEEILTIDPMNREAKMDFFNQVGEALRDLKRWALFAMREDHVAALDPYLRPIPTRLKSTFRLDLLNADAARIAVQRPAKECGVEFTEGATTKLVDDLREVTVQSPTGATEIQLGPYIEPVQLQVVCYRLWEKLPEGVKEITEAQVVGTGDVDSALADYYAERTAQIAGKCGVKERVLREWFDRRLITESGLRSQVMVGSENSREMSEAAVQELVNVHLIRGEERRGVTWLELAHDRLVKPIRANNAAWWERNLSVLQHQAAVWNNQGRSDALCLRGDARKEAQRWADEHADELTQTEREFLEVCQRNHDARTNRWASWAVLGLSVVLGAILFLTVYALKQAKMARAQKEIAESQAAMAQQQTEIAQREKKMANEQQQIAERERTIATAQSIAARAMQLREDRLDVALLLSTEAQRMSDQPDTRGSLLASAYHNPRLTTYLNGPPSPVGAVAFSSDGKFVVTGDFDGNLVLWDTQTHRVIEALPKLVKDAVRTIAFSGDGRWLAVSSKAKSVMRRDLRTGEWKEMLPEKPGDRDVWSVAFSSDSTLLVSADSAGEIHFWDMTSGNVQAFSTGEKNLRAVAFHPSGKMLAVGCASGKILWWALEKNVWVLRERGFTTKNPASPVRCVAFSADGEYLAVGRGEGVADLYAVLEPGKVVKVIATGRHEGAVSALAFSPGTTGLPPDETRLVTASFDGTLRLWKVPSMEQVGPPLTGHVGRVLSVAFSGDKRSVVSGGTDKRAILWDAWVHVAETGRTESDAKFGIAFSPDAAFSAACFDDWRAILQARDQAKWPEYSIQMETPVLAKNGRVPVTTFSGDSARLAMTTREGAVRIYEVSRAAGAGERALIREIAAAVQGPGVVDDGRAITALSLSRDGAMLAASVSQDKMLAKIFVWKVETGEPLFAEPFTSTDDDWNYALAFSPDGSRLVSGGKAERAVVWDLRAKGKPEAQRCAGEHTGKIRCVAFSRDGKMFATGSGDNTLILWETESRRRLSPPLAGHSAPVLVAAFSPDGKRLASGSDDRSVILWDVATRQGTGRLIGHTDSVRAMAFSKDGEQLYTGSWDEESRKWEMDAKALHDICRERANRNLSKGEWTDYMLSGPWRKTWPSLPTPGEERPKK